MREKTCKKSLCLIYILTLLFWSVISGSVSASEITGVVCGESDCYVNHISPTTLISLDKRLPLRENLSARGSEGLETLSATGSQRMKPLSRSVRHTAANLIPCHSYGNLYAIGRQFHQHQIAIHSLCGIIITNYIHHQDGQKS